MLRGHLRPTGTGTEFVGILGWDPVRKAFTCGLVGISAVVLATGVTITVTSASGPGLFACVFGLFGVLTGAASIVAGYRETRRQTAYLRSWITGQMNTPWYGND